MYLYLWLHWSQNQNLELFKFQNLILFGLQIVLMPRFLDSRTCKDLGVYHLPHNPQFPIYDPLGKFINGSPGAISPSRSLLERSSWDFFVNFRKSCGILPVKVDHLKNIDRYSGFLIENVSCDNDTLNMLDRLKLKRLESRPIELEIWPVDLLLYNDSVVSLERSKPLDGGMVLSRYIWFLRYYDLKRCQ